MALDDRSPANACPTIAVTLGEEAWRPEGPPHDRRAQLAATVVINGISHMAMAWAVTTEDGMQAADYNDGQLAQLHDAIAADGPLATVSIFDRDYAIFIAPA